MSSISTATWLSLATGWLATAAAIGVLAAAPDDSPSLLLVPTQPPGRGPLEAGLVDTERPLVTATSGFGR